MSQEHSKQKTNFESTQLANQVEHDHAEALHSAKLGKSLVKKTAKLIKSGQDTKRFISPRLSFDKAEPTSTTLALNAELKEQGIDASASVTQEWNGSIGDPGYRNTLTLKEVEGTPVVAEPTKNR